MIKDRPAGILLVVLGILTVGTGLYFVLGRPAMLPEDVRFTGVAAPSFGSDMDRWLRIVFRTLGAFITAFGLVLGGFGASVLTKRDFWLQLSVVAGTTLAFTQFIASDVTLRSDFLWLVASLCSLALVTSGCVAFQLRERGAGDAASARRAPTGFGEREP